MRIEPAKNPNACPLTRRALLSHLWASVPDCNVFKEGPYYAIRHGRMLAATGARRIDSFSFAEWARKVQDVSL